ncbi:putative ribonuclease H-like domain-containing protein [Rosa chinensis]|uniref:Putative ribonuclease H-like domain-containing protein n=1 Tax=Rosa chinensis TaxID=74649 RepID=A0A2P6PL99_ROSCH|nr:putative ribonuclease H-like domain-containing protein [Rosa chinensis]
MGLAKLILLRDVAVFVFRDSKGLFLGAFAVPSAFVSSIDAEILAVIEAIEIAWVRNWHHLWLETDSTYVVHILSSFSMKVPWYLGVAWANCLWRVRRMNLKYSHIFTYLQGG